MRPVNGPHHQPSKPSSSHLHIQGIACELYVYVTPLSEHSPGFCVLPWANSSPAPLQRQSAKEPAGPTWTGPTSEVTGLTLSDMRVAMERPSS